ncbi:hypothetical protein P3G55_18350 [Leptospira sp. 96542]|nr:hypothetical protein [Leptospira sp. 96542]
MRNIDLISTKLLSNRFSLILIIFWILNDLYFKSLFHNEFTGKISDVIGLFYTPLFFTAIISFCAFTVRYKFNELNVLFFSIISISFFFILLNLNQELNDFLTGKIWFFNLSKGTADFTDIYCLAIIIPLILLFKSGIIRNLKYTYLLKYISPILVSIALLNTSSIGNSESNLDRLLIFNLIADANDKITFLNPKNGENYIENESILFHWKYRNYFGIIEPAFYDKNEKCGNTIELNTLEKNKAGKFDSYILQISNDENFQFILEEINTNQETKIYKQFNNSGTFYFRVVLNYKNFDGCDNNHFLIILPQDKYKINIAK